MLDFSVLYSKLQHELTKLESLEDFFKILPDLRVYAANFKSEKVLELLRSYRKKIELFATPEMTFYLLDLECRQIYDTAVNLPIFEKHLKNMEQLLKQIDSPDCRALYEHLLWTFLLLKNDIDRAYGHLLKAWEIVTNEQVSDYTRYFIQYSYALEQKYKEKVDKIIPLLEECLNYFSKEQFYRGVIRTFGQLSSIAIITKKQQYAFTLVKRLHTIRIEEVIPQLPEDLKILYYYHIGYAYKNNYYLSQAEKYLKKAYQMFISKKNKSRYEIYFVKTMMHLSVIYYLTGKNKLGRKMVRKLKETIKNPCISMYLGNYLFQTEQELRVLEYFINYRKKRKGVLEPENIEKIYEECQKYYTDPILLGFFILTAPLSTEQLEKLYQTPKASLRRIPYVIDYKIQKIRDDFEFKDYERRINCLGVFFRYNLRSEESTLERAFMDALFIRELLYFHKFYEASIVLDRYKDRLKTIEVTFVRKIFKRNICVLKKEKHFKNKEINIKLL
ncbi:MAG: hypothetical protein ACTSYD_10835 [Candidatus Heimdallarchaeaceae archaeon]